MPLKPSYERTLKDEWKELGCREHGHRLYEAISPDGEDGYGWAREKRCWICAKTDKQIREHKETYKIILPPDVCDRSHNSTYVVGILTCHDCGTEWDANGPFWQMLRWEKTQGDNSEWEEELVIGLIDSDNQPIRTYGNEASRILG